MRDGWEREAGGGEWDGQELREAGDGADRGEGEGRPGAQVTDVPPAVSSQAAAGIDEVAGDGVDGRPAGREIGGEGDGGVVFGGDLELFRQRVGGALDGEVHRGLDKGGGAGNDGGGVLGSTGGVGWDAVVGVAVLAESGGVGGGSPGVPSRCWGVRVGKQERRVLSRVHPILRGRSGNRRDERHAFWRRGGASLDSGPGDRCLARRIVSR